MTRIVPRQEQFRVDYQNEHLPALFSKQASDADFSSSLPKLNSEALSQVVCMARLTLLIGCEQLKGESLIQAIKEQAEKGIRIYLLLGEKTANKAAIDTLSGRCLIRTGVSQQGALVLVDHTTTEAQGLLLMSGQPLVAADQSAWGIQLEPQQIDDSFRSFCKLFWEKSNEEYLQQNQQQSSVQHPDGDVVTNHSHQFRDTLNDYLSDTLNQLQAATRTGFSASGDDWRLLLGTQSSDIAKHARTGVALSDNQIPSLLLSSEGNWLLPDQPDFSAANWCLKLSAQQSQEIDQAYDQAFESAAWQYQSETAIGECADKQLLRFADQPGLEYVVEEVRDIELEDFSTQNIDSFLDDDVEQLASGVTSWQRSQLAHFIDYDVVVHPPYCPESAAPDALYQDWEKSEQDWQQRLEVLTNAQSKIDQQQASIADKFRGFIKGFLLGQGQSVKSLNQEIDALKNWSVTSSTPAEREQYRQRLESLLDKIRKRGADTEQELDKARQNESWEQKRSSLQKNIAAKADLTKQRASDFEKLQSETSVRLANVDQEFFKNWVPAAEKLTDEQLDSVSLDDCQSTDVKRQAIRTMTADRANSWKSSVKDKIWKKHYNAFESCLVNHEQGLKKIERDIQEAKAALDKSKAEQERFKKALNEHGLSFVYQRKQASDAFARQLGLTGNKTGESQFQWPSEELPADGTILRQHQQTRYLVVYNKNQIDQARQDAQRLNAEIVCDRESANA